VVQHSTLRTARKEIHAEFNNNLKYSQVERGLERVF